MGKLNHHDMQKKRRLKMVHRKIKKRKTVAVDDLKNQEHTPTRENTQQQTRKNNGEERQRSQLTKDIPAKDFLSNKKRTATFKQRSVPTKTNSSLHELTKVIPNENDESKIHQVNRCKSMRANVWDSDSLSCLVDSSSSNPFNVAAYHRTRDDTINRLEDLLAKEYARYMVVNDCRNFLKKKCMEKLDIPPPVMAWERWQAGKTLLEQRLSENEKDDLDPLLPSCCSSSFKQFNNDVEMNNRDQDTNKGNDEADKILLQDLCRVESISVAGADNAGDAKKKMKAREVVAELNNFCHHRVKTLTKKSINKSSSSLKVSEHKYSWDYVYKNKLLKLNHAHRQKLEKLFTFISSLGTNLQPPSCTTSPRLKTMSTANVSDTLTTDRTTEDQTKKSQLDYNIAQLLLRYHSLLGHGMQCALPEQVFDVCQKHLQTHCEGFASPLNCRYVPYCSAFPDRDQKFGSLGSFFNVFKDLESLKKRFPQGGSFELNPPFIGIIMDEMIDTVEQLLNPRNNSDNNEKKQRIRLKKVKVVEQKEQKEEETPLLFVIILPGWKETKAWQRAEILTNSENSKFAIARILIAAKDHGYVTGAQHQRKDRFLEAPFDTGVFVIANESGKKKFLTNQSCSEEDFVHNFETELRIAFRFAIPTDAEKNRRLIKGRGFGDRDGGGGVYKGKRKKKNIGIKKEKVRRE